MKIRFFALLLLLGSYSAFGIEGVYVGLRAGQVEWLGQAQQTYGSTIGYGFDAGIRLNRVVDFMGTFQLSTHAGGTSGLNVMTQTVSAEFRPLQLEQMNVTLGVGPAVYIFKYGETTMRFGLNLGATAALVVDKHLNLGVSSRYHAVADSVMGSNFFTFMAHVGYLFDVVSGTTSS